MNHFFALLLPEDVREELGRLAEEWRGLDVGRASWYAPADYHITLKFLGNIDPSRQPELIVTSLPLAAKGVTFEVDLNAPAGAFPNLRQPRVLWAGVKKSEPMARLAHEIDIAMATLGFERERRSFHPHITLARCREYPLLSEPTPARSATPPDTGGARGNLPPTPSFARRGSSADLAPKEHAFPLFMVDCFVLMQTLPAKNKVGGDRNTERLRYNIVRAFPFGK